MNVEPGATKPRKMMGIVLAVIIIVAVAAGALYYFVIYSSSPKNVTLTIGTWGGSWGDSLKQVTDQFTQQTGIKVTFSEYGGPSSLVLATLKAQAPNYKIDVFLSGEGVAQRAASAGFTTPIDTSAVSSLANIPSQYQGFINGSLYYVGIYGIVDSIGYRYDKVPAPTSIHDLTKPEYKGKIAVPQPIYSPGELLIQFAMANGGGQTNIQPGFDFAKQLANAGNLAFVYADDASVKNLLSTGEAYVAWGINSNFYDLNHSGVPIKIVKQFSDVKTLVEFDTINVVNGQNKAAAMQFVSYFLNPTNNKMYAEKLGLSPVNTQAQLDPKLAPWSLSSNDVAQFGFHVDPTIVAKNSDAWTQQWNTDVTPLIKPPSG